MSNARPVTIGRDANNTIPLESRLVSKAHALVEFRDGEYSIQDLESANGTRVNGEPTSVRVLEPGDRIEVGDVELSFLDLDENAGGVGTRGAVAAGGGSKGLRLALTGGVTLLVMVGLMFWLVGGLGTTEIAGPAPVENLAPAPAELLTRLSAAAKGSSVVRDVVQHATLAGVSPVQALHEEGRLRLETGRWRDAALLLAAAVAEDPKNVSAVAGFDQAAAQLERAASKALAAAELAQRGMRYEDAVLHADGVLQLVERPDPRYDRALKISEDARTATRASVK